MQTLKLKRPRIKPLPTYVKTVEERIRLIKIELNLTSEEQRWESIKKELQILNS